MTRVETTEQLKQMTQDGIHDFFIQLNHGARSSKSVDYDPSAGRFVIENEMDGTRQRLTEQNLFNERYTNIGKAIRAGAFYAYE